MIRTRRNLQLGKRIFLHPANRKSQLTQRSCSPYTPPSLLAFPPELKAPAVDPEWKTFLSLRSSWPSGGPKKKVRRMGKRKWQSYFGFPIQKTVRKGLDWRGGLRDWSYVTNPNIGLGLNQHTLGEYWDKKCSLPCWSRKNSWSERCCCETEPLSLAIDSQNRM